MDLSHARLRKLPPIILSLAKVRVISLRQNLLSDITGLLDLRTLKELDLYDNELNEISDLSNLSALE